MALLVGGMVLALLVWWLAYSWVEARAWSGYLQALRAQPGIVITDSGRHAGRWQIGGLRDPVAVDPMSLLRGTRIDPRSVDAHWQPYEGLSAPLIARRMSAELKSPPTLSFAVVGDAVIARGSASLGWLQRARTYVASLPYGVARVDLSQVHDLSAGSLGTLRSAIESNTIRFNYNEALPPASEDGVLDELASELQQLESLAASLHVTTRVTVTGHSDATGKGSFNLSLSLARAEAVRALLKKRGVNPDLLSVRGAGPLEPLEQESNDATRSADRRVSLTVSLDE
jgi:OOP family OmpA-OmpF porin